jgi:predicted transcriptional regulator
MGITSVRLSPEVEEKLAAVAERARRTKSWLINEAVRDYLGRLGEDEKRWQETLEALASVRAGRVVEGDDVMAWIASWGKKAEKKPPK